MSTPITSSIVNIKYAGLAMMSYWSILKTTEGLYFVKSASAWGVAVGGGLLTAVSVAGDVLGSMKANQAGTQDLETTLSKAELSCRFGPESFGRLKLKKGLFGGSVTFPNGLPKTWMESGEIKLKLSGKQYRTLLQMIG